MARSLPLVLITAALALAPSGARAHGIETSLSRLPSLSEGLLLQSQFSSGEPTRDAVVRLVPPSGAPIELGRTDALGQLSFALPKGASGDWELQVDGGPGHRDFLEMPVTQGRPELDRLSETRSPGLRGLLAEAGPDRNRLLLGAVAGLAGLGGAGLLRHRSRRSLRGPSSSEGHQS
jgi:nickel transport protein